jgi:hypothetical protein
VIALIMEGRPIAFIEDKVGSEALTEPCPHSGHPKFDRAYRFTVGARRSFRPRAILLDRLDRAVTTPRSTCGLDGAPAKRFNVRNLFGAPPT